MCDPPSAFNSTGSIIISTQRSPTRGGFDAVGSLLTLPMDQQIGPLRAVSAGPIVRGGICGGPKERRSPSAGGVRAGGPSVGGPSPASLSAKAHGIPERADAGQRTPLWVRAAQGRGALVRGQSVRGGCVTGCGAPAAAFVGVVHAEVSRLKLHLVAPSTANAMKAKTAAKAMSVAKAKKAVKAKKAAGATSGKWTKVRSLQSLLAACCERRCYLDARYDGCHIWKQKIDMHLKKMGYELRQKQEALRAHKRVAKTKTTSEFEKEQRERSRGTSESEERHCQLLVKWLKKSSAEWDRELANIAKELKRKCQKEKKVMAALEKLGIVPDKRHAIVTSQPARLAEPPEKCQRRQTLDDAPQLETASPPSTPSTTADSQQNVGHSATRQSDDEPLGNPEVTPPSSAVCDLCKGTGRTGHLMAHGTFPMDLFAGPSLEHRLPDQTKEGIMVRGRIPGCGVRSVNMAIFTSQSVQPPPKFKRTKHYS